LAATPQGFIPTQDQGNLLVSITLPPGASLARTDAITRQVAAALMTSRASQAASTYAGVDATTGTTASNGGQIYLILKSFEERARLHMSPQDVMADLKKKLAPITGAEIRVIQPPSVRGIGSTGGWKMIVEDQGGHGPQALEAVANELAKAASQNKAISGAFVTFNTRTPRLFADIDRTKAEMLGVPDSAVFSTLQTYLGSTFINDFNLFGHTFQVLAQADGAPGLGGQCPARHRTLPRASLRPLSRRGDSGRHRQGLFHRPIPGRHGAARARAPAARVRLRVDRTGVPAEVGGQHRDAGVRHGRGVRLPPAGRPL
jgi:multidrug efflux pump subunit AcrB